MLCGLEKSKPTKTSPLTKPEKLATMNAAVSTSLLSDNTNAYTMFSITGKAKPIIISVKLHNKDIQMELDIGVTLSICSEETYRSIFGDKHRLDQSDIVLRTYTGENLSVLGAVDNNEGQIATLPLVVVEGHGASLFGRNWLMRYCVNWSSIHYTAVSIMIS